MAGLELDNSTGYLLKLGGKSQGQQNMVNMVQECGARLPEFKSQPCHLLPTSQGCEI